MISKRTWILCGDHNDALRTPFMNSLLCSCVERQCLTFALTFILAWWNVFTVSRTIGVRHENSHSISKHPTTLPLVYFESTYRDPLVSGAEMSLMAVQTWPTTGAGQPFSTQGDQGQVLGLRMLECKGRRRVQDRLFLESIAIREAGQRLRGLSGTCTDQGKTEPVFSKTHD
jgi:hypothetical protein